VVRAVAADRVDGLGIASKQECLTAAATEVTLLTGTGEAGFRHPGISAEAFKRPGGFPYPRKVMFAHVVEVQARNDSSLVAGQRISHWIDQHRLPSPAADTGLGEAAKVIGEDRFNLDSAFEPLFGGFDDRQRSIHLFLGGHQ
jgi:hypothetical protein